MKLVHIGEYIINPDNIAYIETWKDIRGEPLGSRIVFTAYAAAANITDWNYDPLAAEIRGLTPVQIMDFINNGGVDNAQ